VKQIKAGIKTDSKKDLHISALTIDVEDAVNQAMRNFFGQDMEPTSRVVDNTMRLLELLNQYNVKATFFILGEVARTFPGLIRNISTQGHELGIHGYSHERYHKLTREQLRKEITTAKNIVEDITGIEVIGHRAPEFSINYSNQWVFEELLDAGIKYDSSVVPLKTGRYGWEGFNRKIEWLEVPDGRKIIEFPLSVGKLLGREIPVCGGGYLRAMPYHLTSKSFRVIAEKHPVNVYLHPYEIDRPPFQSFYMQEIKRAPMKYRIKIRGYWFNRRSVMPKIENLLQTYQFDTVQKVINDYFGTNL